jgi:hypothetical protein
MNALLILLALQSPVSSSASAEAKKNPTPPVAAAAEADNEVVERRVCTKEKDERVLETLPKEKGCVLQYTKGGKTEEKAKSVRGVQVCQDALKKIATRLEAAGYKCE